MKRLQKGLKKERKKDGNKTCMETTLRRPASRYNRPSSDDACGFGSILATYGVIATDDIYVLDDGTIILKQGKARQHDR